MEEYNYIRSFSDDLDKYWLGYTKTLGKEGTWMLYH